MINKKTDLSGTSTGYKVFAVVILVLITLFFLFPLYWIVTGSFKDAIEINAREPIWFPQNPTLDNYARLFEQPAFLWLFNIVFISAMAMILTCITASLAGYALGKKRFYGRGILFTIIICAMALPKQVIVIPLLQEMTAIHLNNNIWAVILPTVGWPFGVFLMKQFSETVPTEILEAARVDGAGELRTFFSVVFPMIKPGIGALAIFTFVNTWNDYFLQLVRDVLRLRPDHGRRGPGLHPHHRGVYRLPEVLHPGHCHGRREGLSHIFHLQKDRNSFRMREGIIMSDLNKYRGVIPAFYACYDDEGNISPERVRGLTRYLIGKGVNGLYVGGSSGECIYQGVEERKVVLENVMAEAKGKVVIIAHVACNNTADSRELAAHAESLGVDAIAAIPPIYFHLPEYAIAQYWNDISAAAPNTDFVIYNIPQLAGVALTPSLLKEMQKNPRVIAVKNSSMPVQDIQMWKDAGVLVFNGPDEQYISGLAMGACAGIGGTYAVMPELFLKVYEHFQKGEMEPARQIQNDIDRIIYKMCEAHGNLYAVQKAILAKNGVPCGSVRKPMPALIDSDTAVVEEAHAMIAAAIAKYC